MYFFVGPVWTCREITFPIPSKSLNDLQFVTIQNVTEIMGLRFTY
jgi:hypothetical protein